MLFQTWPFLIFFLATYPVYLLVRNTRGRLPFLLVTSYLFYAWLGPLYLLPIAYATVVDYLVVARMARSTRRRLWLSVSVINSVAVLGFFKYGQFIVDNVNVLLATTNAGLIVPDPAMPLAAGMSFYLFQSMAYVIDCYRGTVQRETSFIAHAAYVSFFPRLLMGPIERGGNLIPQLKHTPRVTSHDIAEGLSLFVVGLFKKVALADYLALYVNKVYTAPESFNGPALVLATFFFAWQIYFDFSGYTDMARGVGRLMGIRLMLNFRNPYLAASLGEFWGRWHISLSSWFKDYVYIPLGGNREGTLRTYRNIFLTMVLSGLWHGAAWTFVLWGVVHALMRFATRELEKTNFYKNTVPKLVKRLFVFGLVMFAWIFFRAESIGDAWTVISRMVMTQPTNPQCPVLALFLIGAVWGYQYLFESRLGWLLRLRLVRLALVVLMLAYLAIVTPASQQAFIYMQF